MANSAELLVRILGDSSQLSSELGKAGKEAEGFGSKVGGALKVGLATAGAAGAAALAYGFSESLSREKITEQAAASLGLSGEESEKFGSAAGDLYANAWGDSVEDATAAIAANVEQGLVDITTSTEAELQHVGAMALDIATAMGEDTARVTAAAGQLVKNGLAKDAAAAYDLLAEGQTNGLNRADDLLDTLNEYSPAFQRLGFTGADALGIIESGLESGIFNTDKIGDAFNEFQIRAIDGSKSTREAIESLGMDYDVFASKVVNGGESAKQATIDVMTELAMMENGLEADAAGVALFGSMWEDLGEEAIASLNPVNAGLFGVQGAAQDLSDGMNDNLLTTLEALKRKGFDKLVEVGDKYLAPMLTTLIEKGEQLADWFGENGIAGAWQLVVDKWDSLGPVMQAVLVGVGAATVAAGLYAAALGVVTLATGAWAAITAVAGVAVAVATSPVTLIILAIAALAAGVYYAYNRFEGFRRVVDGVGRFLRDTVWPILKRTAEVIFNALSNPVETVKNAWNGLKTFFSGLPAWFLDKAKMIGSKILDGLKSGISSLVGIRSSLQDALWRAVKSLVNSQVIDKLNRGIPDSIQWGPIGVDLPDNPIPRLATGTTSLGKGGLHLVGERGPEAVWLPTGAGVQPAHNTTNLGGNTFNIIAADASPYKIAAEIGWLTNVRGVL